MNSLPLNSPRSSSILAFCLLFLVAWQPQFHTQASAQQVPDRVLVGYWHNWAYSPNNLTLAMLPDEYDVINVSFAIPSVAFGSSMTFAPDPTLYPIPGDFLTDMTALKAKGKKVLISIGGANGPIHLNNAADVSTFVTTMHSIITTWGFDGLDIDLEGGSLSLGAGDSDFSNPTTPKIVNFIAAMNQLLALLPGDFMLTAAPETATLQGGYSAYAGVWGSYLAVIHALRSKLDWVQVQHYNTGSMFGRDGVIYNPATPDFHVAMADMLISGFNVPASGKMFPPLAPEQVVIGLPSTTSAAGTGFTNVADVHRALDHLYLGHAGTNTYPLGTPTGYLKFRGVMTWSINWDVNAGGIFSKSHRSYLDDLHLASSTNQVSYSAGGTVNFNLRAGLAHAGRVYYLVPTLSGTSPGTWIRPGEIFPITLDAVSYWPFQAGTAAFFPGFLGVLDSQGNATASMIVPPTIGQPAFTSHYGFILEYPWDFFSDALKIDFIP